MAASFWKNFGSRIVIVEKKMEAALVFQEEMYPTTSPKKTIPLDHKITEFTATQFIHDGNPYRHSTISIFMNGENTDKSLSSRDFLSYYKIILELKSDGTLKATGIKAPFSEFGRIKGLGIFFRRRYKGDVVQKVIFGNE